jgi:hypothetical protein
LGVLAGKPGGAITDYCVLRFSLNSQPITILPSGLSIETFSLLTIDFLDHSPHSSPYEIAQLQIEQLLRSSRGQLNLLVPKSHDFLSLNKEWSA